MFTHTEYTDEEIIARLNGFDKRSIARGEKPVARSLEKWRFANLFEGRQRELAAEWIRKQ